MVAQKLGRGAVLIDLNRDYQPMMESRVRGGNVGLPLGTNSQQVYETRQLLSEQVAA
jgi:hypothetical protein